MKIWDCVKFESKLSDYLESYLCFNNDFLLFDKYDFNRLAELIEKMELLDSKQIVNFIFQVYNLMYFYRSEKNSKEIINKFENLFNLVINIGIILENNQTLISTFNLNQMKIDLSLIDNKQFSDKDYQNISKSFYNLYILFINGLSPLSLKFLSDEYLILNCLFLCTTKLEIKSYFIYPTKTDCQQNILELFNTLNLFRTTSKYTFLSTLNYYNHNQDYIFYFFSKNFDWTDQINEEEFFKNNKLISKLLEYLKEDFSTLTLYHESTIVTDKVFLLKKAESIINSDLNCIFKNRAESDFSEEILIDLASEFFNMVKTNYLNYIEDSDYKLKISISSFNTFLYYKLNRETKSLTFKFNTSFNVINKDFFGNFFFKILQLIENNKIKEMRYIIEFKGKFNINEELLKKYIYPKKITNSISLYLDVENFNLICELSYQNNKNYNIHSDIKYYLRTFEDLLKSNFDNNMIDEGYITDEENLFPTLNKDLSKKFVDKKVSKQINHFLISQVTFSHIYLLKSIKYENIFNFIAKNELTIIFYQKFLLLQRIFKKFGVKNTFNNGFIINLTDHEIIEKFNSNLEFMKFESDLLFKLEIGLFLETENHLINSIYFSFFSNRVFFLFTDKLSNVSTFYFYNNYTINIFFFYISTEFEDDFTNNFINFFNQSGINNVSKKLSDCFKSNLFNIEVFFNQKNFKLNINNKNSNWSLSMNSPELSTLGKYLINKFSSENLLHSFKCKGNNFQNFSYFVSSFEIETLVFKLNSRSNYEKSILNSIYNYDFQTIFLKFSKTQLMYFILSELDLIPTKKIVLYIDFYFFCKEYNFQRFFKKNNMYKDIEIHINKRRKHGFTRNLTLFLKFLSVLQGNFRFIISQKKAFFERKSTQFEIEESEENLLSESSSPINYEMHMYDSSSDEVESTEVKKYKVNERFHYYHMNSLLIIIYFSKLCYYKLKKKAIIVELAKFLSRENKISVEFE